MSLAAVADAAAILSVTAAASATDSVDPDEVGAGTIGFFVIGGIAVLTFFLWRSMNKQLRKVDFEQPPTDERPTLEQPLMDPRPTDLPVSPPEEPRQRREGDPS